MVFYLKYRPKKISELDNEELREKLDNLLKGNLPDKIPHAFLFTGPKGLGKTSTARILAKMVNCEKQNETPCNKCSTCLSITDGSNLDLIEIDAASNRGIEDIRSLRDKIKLSPTSARKKVYIIDEVHMLTTEAFNALLKTLEEPPAHALFILATTESSKVPQTILSRVQRLDFKLARPDEISLALSKIIKEEKIDIDPEALKVLVRRADGSFRDGVKLLDQVSSFKGKITTKSLEENFNFKQFDEILDLLKSLSEQNSTKSLLNISKQVENGIDIKELLLALMDTLRNLMFIKNGLGDDLVRQQFSEDKYEELTKLAESFTNQDLVKDLTFLQQALEQLKFASIPSLPLELSVVEICNTSSVTARSPARSADGSLNDSHEVTKQSSLSVEDSSLIARNDKERIQDDKGKNQKRSAEIGGEQITDKPEENESDLSDLSVIRHTDTSISPTSPASDSADILKLKEKWNFVLETIRAVNFSLEALLRSVNITECTETTVIMEVPYSFHQRILEAPKNRDLLEGVFSDILGRSIRISIALGSRPVRREDVANIEIAQDDEIIRAAAEIFNSDS